MYRTFPQAPQQTLWAQSEGEDLFCTLKIILDFGWYFIFLQWMWLEKYENMLFFLDIYHDLELSVSMYNVD